MNIRLKDIRDIISLPRVSINLMFEKTRENNPFFAQAVTYFYKEATSLHPKLLFVRKFQHGFALCKLPPTFDEYFKSLEFTARQNYRKAQRSGYTVRRFDFNSHLSDVSAIWSSTPVRQGRLPEDIREGRVRPIHDPPSQTLYHDYPYFGVFRGERLYAYAACLIVGELCNLNDIYGHADYLRDGIVPLMIIEIAREVLKSYPTVKYYGYGTYFGASESMRRFKRKFLFYPHRTTWVLESKVNSSNGHDNGISNGDTRLIYQMKVSAPLRTPAPSVGLFFIATRYQDILTYFWTWKKNWGWRETLRISLKILSGRRKLFGIKHHETIIQSGWANLGFCRYYPVESSDVVLGTLWTHPEFRCRGLASTSIQLSMSFLYQHGYRSFYIDTTHLNIASQRMIQKAGFLQRSSEVVSLAR